MGAGPQSRIRSSRTARRPRWSFGRLHLNHILNPALSSHSSQPNSKVLNQWQMDVLPNKHPSPNSALFGSQGNSPSAERSGTRASAAPHHLLKKTIPWMMSPSSRRSRFCNQRLPWNRRLESCNWKSTTSTAPDTGVTTLPEKDGRVHHLFGSGRWSSESSGPCHPLKVPR